METPPLHVVLVAPSIPLNTGSIGRLCVCTDARLHLVRPLGFSLEEPYLHRAGLDYWRLVDVQVHDDWSAFCAAERPERLQLITAHGQRSYTEATYQAGDYLVFGNESTGLPAAVHERYPEQRLRIPMPGRNARTLNLACAASIVVYEALRQLRLT